MPRTRIKICGVTRPQDASAAAAAGADAVGIVFYSQTARYVPPERALPIVEALPPFVPAIGLFVDSDAATIKSILQKIPLAAVQLHGHESPELIAQLQPIRVIKAIHVEPSRFAQELRHWRQAITELALTNLIGLLLETGGTSEAGGSGVANDWDLLARHAEAGDLAELPPLIAAGGLTPQTVGDVVRKLRPWAVDVSSGVEISKGQKSPKKIAAFVQAVRNAE